VGEWLGWWLGGWVVGRCFLRLSVLRWLLPFGLPVGSWLVGLLGCGLLATDEIAFWPQKPNLSVI